MAGLVQKVQELVAGLDGRAAVYARRLDTGDQLAVGASDEHFATGSAAKLSVLLAFADRAVAGALDPSARVEVTEAFREARPGSGVLRFLAGGLTPTLRDCATLMMIVSDNVATDLVLDALGGPGPVNEIVAGLGAHDVDITSPTVWALPPAQFAMASPRGLASAWELLAGSDPVAQLCRSITWRNQHREGFARFVPFAPDLVDFDLVSPLGLWSKSGSYPTVSCEAGLFETDSARWVLAVMADQLADWGNGSAAAGPTLRAEVARAVFDTWG